MRIIPPKNLKMYSIKKFVKETTEILNTRDLGEKFRNMINNNLEEKEKIVLNFEKVNSISQSFADESLGKLVQRIGFSNFKEKIKMINLNENNISVVRYVISQRLKKANRAVV